MRTIESESETTNEFDLDKLPDAVEANPAELTEAEQQAVQSVEAVLPTLGPIEPTALPVIKLYLYNFFHIHEQYTREELDRQIGLAMRLSKQEEKYSSPKNPLPTVGIELEVPDQFFTMPSVRVLDKFNIPNGGEITIGNNKPLWELRPNFSYSPWVQGQYIEELTKLGAVPLNERTGKVSDDQILSLHLNFGIPEDIQGSKLKGNGLYFEVMSDLLGYAFASPERILARKTSESYKLKSDAEASSKNAKSQTEESTLAEPLRVELRAGEFRDFPTFRMITESQRLMASLFSWFRIREHLPSSDTDKKLAALFEKLIEESVGLVESRALRTGVRGNTINLFDRDKEMASFIMEETDVRDESRKLITKYSQQIELLVPETDEDPIESGIE